MIRLSRLADYSVALMTHMADQPDRMLNGTDLAAALHLPPPTVSKLLGKLARAGLLTSYRGVEGGYTLARRPDSITMADIISAVDGPIAMTECIETSVSGGCTIEAVCPARASWQKINDAVRNALAGVTLADVIPPPSPWIAARRDSELADLPEPRA